MPNTDYLRYLEELRQIPTLSGFENAGQKEVQQLLAPLFDDSRPAGVSGLLFTKKCPCPPHRRPLGRNRSDCHRPEGRRNPDRLLLGRYGCPHLHSVLLHHSWKGKHSCPLPEKALLSGRPRSKKAPQERRILAFHRLNIRGTDPKGRSRRYAGFHGAFHRKPFGGAALRSLYG